MASTSSSSSNMPISDVLKHLIQGRWISLFSSILILGSVGGSYIFSAYSKEIKYSLGYDQTTLNLLGFTKEVGTNIGIISGLLAEVIPTWLLLLIGSAMNLIGFLSVWLAVTGKMSQPKVWQMCIFMFVGANSSTFTQTGAMATSVRNFAQNRGVLIGLLMGFAGLSGGIMLQICLAIYGNDSKSLIFFIGWLPTATLLVSAFTVRVINLDINRKENQTRVLYQFLYVSIVLALYIMSTTLIQKLIAFPKSAYAANGMAICSLLLVLLVLAIREELYNWKNKNQYPVHPTKISIERLQELEPNSETPLLPPSLQENEQTRTPFFENIMNKPERGEDYTILQALISIDMLILFIAASCGLGTSLTLVDNLGQIGESLEYPTKSIQTSVSLVSIWSFFGRISVAVVSDDLVHKHKIPRPFITTLILIFQTIAHLLIAVSAPGCVYLASVIVGFSCGAQYPLLNITISELFGLKHYPTLFNFGSLGVPIASYILNVKITGSLYDKEALKGMNRSVMTKELTCIGSRCYRLSSIILATVALFGSLGSLVLAVRTQEFYRRDNIHQMCRKGISNESSRRGFPSDNQS